MSRGIRIGTIAGIPVSASASVLLIVALLTLGLSQGVLPAAGGLSPAGRLLMGLGGAVLFLGSLLAHELGHALVARRAGIHVEGIQLWLFGGVARLSSEAKDARSALRIAAIGPAVSLALAAVGGAAAVALAAVGAPAATVAVLGWLAAVNAVLGLFNLLPGLPLDGGRILQAVLWRRSGDPARATMGAAGAGRVVGSMLIGLGVVQLVGGAGLGGLWTAALGWMISGAATAEREAAHARRSLAGLPVGAVMEPAPVPVAGWTSVDDFLAGPVAAEGRAAHPLRTWDGRLDGLLLTGRLPGVPDTSVMLRTVAVPGEQVDTARPDEEIVDVLLRLRPFAEGHVVVLDDDGRIVGLVSPASVRRALLEREALAPG